MSFTLAVPALAACLRFHSWKGVRSHSGLCTYWPDSMAARAGELEERMFYNIGVIF